MILNRRPRRQRSSLRRCRAEVLEARRLLTAEIEPNDTGATATALVVGELLEGQLSSENDIDYFSAQLAVGENLRISTQNQNAPRFNQTLPPGIEIFGPDGQLLQTSTDGRGISFVAYATGQYLISISSQNEFGTFVGDYGMQSTHAVATGNTETEPNDLVAEANGIPLGRPFSGSIDSLTDVDLFTLNANPDDVVVVSFAGLTEQAPAVRIENAAGVPLAINNDGNGLVYQVDTPDQLYVQIDGGAGRMSGEYDAVINVFSEGEVATDLGSDFASAYEWNFDFPGSMVGGTLSDPNDVDVFRFVVDEISFVDFDLELSGSERIVESGKEMRIYNQFGQFKELTTTRSINTDLTDALVPGVYYLTVSAASPVGTGAYAINSSIRTNISLQRDNTVHYMDFDSTDPYLGFARVNSYAHPSAQPFYVGMFDARYGIYDVETVTSQPIVGAERVAQGIGDFGDIGAGGFGGGHRGVRSSWGNAVTNALEGNVNNLRYYTTPTVNHEYGHAVGLPHARDVQAVMSYVGTTEYLPVGSAFGFIGTDSRRPGNRIDHVRDYLDWTLQPGAQIVAPEQGSNVVNLDALLEEMELDHRATQSVDVGDSPIHVITADFNADSIPDLAVANSNDDNVQVFITGANGVLGAPVTLDPTGDIQWWTEPLVAGDFDGDGDDDLAVGVYGTSNVRVFLSNGDGTFAAGVNNDALNAVQGLAVGDLDLDGDLDLVASTPNDQVKVFLGVGDGTFGAATRFDTGDNPFSVAIGDFDRNGIPDIVTADQNSDTVSLLSGDGTGAFTLGNTFTVGDQPRGIVSADLNGDGAPDFATANLSGRSVTVMINRGGQFERTDYPVRVPPQRITAGDLNGDGFADLAAGSFSAALQVLINDQAGEFGRAVSFESGVGEASAAIADFDGDNQLDIAITTANSDRLSILQDNDDPQNDRVVAFGNIADVDDVDRFQLTVSPGDTYTFDIEAAEFQYSLDATLTVYDSSGNVIGQSLEGIDGNSGIESVDPFLRMSFTASDVVTIEVDGYLGSRGDYRLKVTPERAFDTEGPRVIASYPDGGETVNATNQLVFFFDDQIDPDSLLNQIVVQGDSTGFHSGTAVVNPLDASVVWTANSALPVDTYTVNLSGNAGGIADFFGNVLDGETTTFAFPEVSGDGVPGGNFTMNFTINADDPNPATVNSAAYLRDPYNRGRFTVRLSDRLSIESVHTSDFTLRGPGADRLMGTADDTFQELDPVYDPIRQVFNSPLHLYSRGIPDSGEYVIEGTVVDGAGHTVTIAEPVGVFGSIPESALFTDVGLTQNGLTGTYINSNLRGYAPQDDWRTSQTVAGTRVDRTLSLSTPEFGVRSTVGITGGVDDTNWDDFSAQWDGWITVPVDGTRLATRSDDGSRAWVDINGDGVFNANTELFDNGWGTAHGTRVGDLSAPLPAGTYQVRVQYEDGTGGNEIHLEWILPGLPVNTDGFIHGPSVTDTSITPGSQITINSPAEVSVTFSAEIDTNSLTVDNFVLRRSDDAVFYDGNDTVLVDSDGVIDWDPTTFQATLSLDAELSNAYYMIDLNGSTGGIVDLAGNLLDGEYLDSTIAGNNNPFIWQHSPSGNGVAGGDYRAVFDIARPELTVDIVHPSVSENGGVTSAIVRREFADLTGALPITISISDATELTSSVSAVIPAGSDSVAVQLIGVDDDLLDGDQIVLVTASSVGIPSGSDTVIVEDHEQFNLLLSSARISENGGQAVLTISRNDTRGILTAIITNDSTDEADVIGQVTFQDGESTATVDVTGVDDSLLDGTQLVTLRVTAQGMLESRIAFEVTDHEELLLNIVEDSISESGDFATATITRTDSTDAAFATLTEDPAGLLVFPSIVQFAAGQLVSAPFPVSAIDNSLLDPVRIATLTASVNGYIPGSDQLQITDFEQLEVTLNENSISELDGQTLARVTRTDPSTELIVQLATDDDTTISLVDQVVIRIGELSSDPFVVTSIDNTTVDGVRTANITASATAYFDGSASIDVTDYEPLSLSVLTSPITEDVGQIDFRITRPNTGAQATVFLGGGIAGLLNVPSQVVFQANEDSVQFTAEVEDNARVGDDFVDAVITASALGYISDNLAIQIQEDDEPNLNLTLESSIITEGQNVSVATLQRNTQNPLTVRLVPDPQNGDLVMPETIEFPGGLTRITFEFSAQDNQIVDGNRNFTISAIAEEHPTATAGVQVLDNDIAGVSFLTTPELSVSEEGADGVLVLQLSAAPQTPVQLDFATSGDALLTVNPASLTFGPRNWDQPQFVRVSAIDDNIVGSGQVQAITITPSSNSDAAFLDIQESVPVTILDDDIARIEMTQTDGATIVSEIGLDDQFSLRLSGQPIGNVILTIDGAEVPEAVFTPQTLTFTPQNWAVEQTVVVTTPLDFDEDQHSIGSIYVRVDDSTDAYGYRDLEGRVLAVVHVDSVLNDLRVRRNDETILLLDDVTNGTLRSVSTGTTQTLAMGSRGETVTVESSLDGQNLVLQTRGGDDVINLLSYDFSEVDGGDGFDTLRPSLQDVTYDLDAGSQQLRNIERIELSADGAQTLRLTPDAVRRVTGAENTLVIDARNPEDQVIIGEGWTLGEPKLVAGIPTHQLLQDNAVVQVSSGAMWHNPFLDEDVDRSGEVTSLDALVIINRLKVQEREELPGTFAGSTPFYYDVNEDNSATSLDALLVINRVADELAQAEAELVDSGILRVPSAQIETTEQTYLPEEIVQPELPGMDPAMWFASTVDSALIDVLDAEGEETEDESLDDLANHLCLLSSKT